MCLLSLCLHVHVCMWLQQSGLFGILHAKCNALHVHVHSILYRGKYIEQIRTQVYISFVSVMSG